MSFSARIIALRRERGMTQQGFADATGIHVQQIKRYEANTSQPSADALKKIAKCFGVTTDWLVFEEDERGPSDALRLQFEAVSQLPPEEQSVVKEVLDSLIIKYQARRWDSARTAAPEKKAASSKRQASVAVTR
jgi:transcriptional regulator with XRE-family HTH domain